MPFPLCNHLKIPQINNIKANNNIETSQISKYLNSQNFMHASSIQTQYYDQNDFTPPSNFYHHQATTQKKQMSPSGSGLALRIEQNIKQYQQQIKKNRHTINQLECQRSFFDKLSLKQKEKIEQIDLGQLRAEYEKRVFMAKQQVGELHQVITLLQQQQHQAEESYMNTYHNVASNKDFLMETLINMEKENEDLQRIVGQSQKELCALELQIGENERIIKEKEAVHRKYVELQIQIQRLEKILKMSPKKRG